MSATYNGLEICYYAFKEQVKRESDLVVLFVHWYLVKNGFTCVVNGRATEILSPDWNNDEDIYVIHYSFGSKGFELKALMAENSLIINLMKKSNERTANITCRIKDHVAGLNKEFQNLYFNLQDLHDNINKEFHPLFTETKSQTEEPEKHSPHHQHHHHRRESAPQSSPYDPDPLRVTRPGLQPVFPDNYGRSDLDPFAFDPLSRGGMVFDPFRNPERDRYIPGNLPPGAVPPGARFDPYGPPNPDDLMPGYSRVGPNPSHLRPPQFDPYM